MPFILALILIIKAVKTLGRSSRYLWRYLIFAILLLLANITDFNSYIPHLSGAAEFFLYLLSG